VTSQVQVNTPEAPTTLGQRVRQARVARGLTQSGLADSRFSKQYVSQIERDQLRPTDATLRWIADRLDVDLMRAAEDKIVQNERKYPAERVRGDSRKYTEYD